MIMQLHEYISLQLQSTRILPVDITHIENEWMNQSINQSMKERSKLLVCQSWFSIGT